MPSSSKSGSSGPKYPYSGANTYTPGGQLAHGGGWQQGPIDSYMQRIGALGSSAPLGMPQLGMPQGMQAGTIFRGQGGPAQEMTNYPTQFQMPSGPRSPLQINPQTGQWELYGGMPLPQAPPVAPVQENLGWDPLSQQINA